MSRPLVQVYDIEAENKVSSSVTMPAVFQAPIRHDVVHYVHSLMAKNNRQAYAVTRRAGMMTPAVSWGTGRAAMHRMGAGCMCVIMLMVRKSAVSNMKANTLSTTKRSCQKEKVLS